MGSSSSSPLAVLVQRGVHLLFMSLVPAEVVAGMKVEHDFFPCSAAVALHRLHGQYFVFPLITLILPLSF